MNLIKFGFSTKIGFVGIGNMGVGMIHNLAKQYQVYGYDANTQWKNNIQSDNIIAAQSFEEVVKQVDTVVTMLPNDKIVKGIAEQLFKTGNKTLIDSSTISPYASYELAEYAKKTGNIYADAPVSGGVGGAKMATLTFMVGADKQLFDKVSPILKLMGKNIFHCGNVGGGQVAKMCNNMALAIQMISVAEALSLGKNLNMDPKMLSSIMSVSSSRCWSVDTYNPAPGVLENVPSNNDYEGGFMVELMLKDLRIAIDAAERSNTNCILGKQAKQLYERLSELYARKDFGIVFRELSNKRL